MCNQDLVLSESLTIKTGNIKKFEGDCACNLRKKKVIITYDIAAEIEWVHSRIAAPGADAIQDNITKGVFKFPSISMENEAHEHEIEISVTSTHKSAGKMRDDVKAKAKTVIMKKLAEFIEEVMAYGREAQAGIPSTGSQASVTSSSSQNDSASPMPVAKEVVAPAVDVVKKSSSSNSNSSSTSSGGSKSQKKKTTSSSSCLQMTVELSAPKGEVFLFFSDEGRLRGYLRSACTFSPVVGQPFSLLDGIVQGSVLTVEPPNRLVLSWRMREWPAGLESRVTLVFKDGNSPGSCVVELKQENLPQDEEERMREGWQRFFWDRIRGCFGISVNMK